MIHKLTIPSSVGAGFKRKRIGGKGRTERSQLVATQPLLFSEFTELIKSLKSNHKIEKAYILSILVSLKCKVRCIFVEKKPKKYPSRNNPNEMWNFRMEIQNVK